MQWRRILPDDASLEIFGDHDVFDRWLALPVPRYPAPSGHQPGLFVRLTPARSECHTPL